MPTPTSFFGKSDFREMMTIPKVAILLETNRSFDRHLLRGVSQYSRLYGPWAFHIECDGLDRLKPDARLWNCSGMIARRGSRTVDKVIDEAKVPIVVVDSNANPSMHHTSRVANIIADSTAIEHLAAEHYSSRGIKHFAIVGELKESRRKPLYSGGDRSIWCAGGARLAYLSYLSHKQPWAMERDALANWLVQLPKPIGILASDDERGLQVLDACRNARLSVPNEVAVMGIGNDELICSLADPPLSSVAINAVHGGFRAALFLDRLMQNSVQTPQELVVHPSGVILRSSTDIDISHDSDVSAARSVISRHSSQKLSIKDLAKSIGISRRTLEQKFRRNIGRTILEEIQEVRLTRAKHILKETELPVAEVAASSGYSSVSYFVKLFAKQIGLTPAKYRKASSVSNICHDNSSSGWPTSSAGKLTVRDMS